MTIRCPYCPFTMELAGVHPGRFTPKCQACHRKFLLVVLDVAGQMPIVEAIAEPALPRRNDETPHSAIEAALGMDGPGPGGVLRQHTVVQSLDRQRPVTSSPDITAVPGATFAPAEAHVAETVVPSSDTDLHGTLGGYELLRKLGQGGMGAVYLARQISLDRNVAIKVLAPQLSHDPQFVARFTREAHAAAQLTHHNVVQIHDIGQQNDVNFFSMEYVEGQTLSHVVAESGKIDPETAVGFALQAARGLKFAHDHAMIHRDIKPENLMLNSQGIVKVADLGLVKRAGETSLTAPSGFAASAAYDVHQNTQLNVSMGTPAYMAPEQAQDAATVDQRADIYSLGCTLYDLLTGRPPFVGRTAMEVITKHAREQIVPPDAVVKNVPKSLSQVILKMVAKRPNDRYATMNEVIRAFEDFLGVATSGPFTPKEEHVKILEFAVERFNSSTWAGLRTKLIALFFAACAILFAVFAVKQSYFLAGGVVGFAVLSFVIYQLIVGVQQRTTLFLKARSLVFGSGIIDWLMWLIGAGLVLTLLVFFDLHLAWLAGALLAGAVAAGFHFGVDVLVDRERTAPVLQVQAMLKQMRLRGLDELAIRQFVCKFSGERWEAFYEELFGYDAKIQARTAWGKGEKGRDRKRYAAWRDVIIHWIDQKLQSRREERERRLLQKVEQRALAAKGISEEIARKQAWKNADRAIEKATRARTKARRKLAETAVPAPAAPKSTETLPPGATATPKVVTEPVKKKTIDERTIDDEPRVHESYIKRRFGGPLDILLGQHVRFALACIILLGFGFWFRQTDARKAMAELQAMNANRQDVVETAASNAGRAINMIRADIQNGKQPAALRPVPFVPEKLSMLLSRYTAALAGVLLLASIFFEGRVLGIIVLLSAAVALMGWQYDLPIVNAFLDAAVVSSALAVGLWLFGVIFFRVQEGY